MKIRMLTVSAVLAMMPAAAPLSFAQPSGMGPQIMQARTDACKGKAENDACSFTGANGQTIKGTCVTMRGELMCHASGMGMGGMGGGGVGGGGMGGMMGGMPGAAPSPASK
jgi:hypothetical protein